ncbi:MAG: hypothetical protein NW216_03765 [Hyphomicrobium sp.]|nr:hypothetical protein [Hyphomicrobium sp.]
MSESSDIEISDEMLVAYVDGTLSDEEARIVEAAIAARPELRKLVRALAHSGQLARDAYVLPETAEDDAIAAMIKDSAPRAASTAGSPNVISISAARKAKQGSISRYALPMAAAIVLICGAGVALMTLDQPGKPVAIAEGPVAEGTTLAELLETKPSGSHAAIESSAGGNVFDASVVATYRGADDRLCREVEFGHEDPENSALTIALACRSPDAKWTILGTVEIAEAADVAPDFKPSEGESDNPVEKLLRGQGLSSAVSAVEERRLIEGQWR